MEIFTSKKIQLAGFGSVVAVFGDKLGLTPDQIAQIVMLFSVAIGGVALADFGKEKAKIEKTTTPTVPPL